MKPNPVVDALKFYSLPDKREPVKELILDAGRLANEALPIAEQMARVCEAAINLKTHRMGDGFLKYMTELCDEAEKLRQMLKEVE